MQFIYFNTINILVKARSCRTWPAKCIVQPYLFGEGSMRVFGCVVVLALGFSPAFVAENSLRWVCYYSDSAPVSAFDNFDLLILDSEHHPDLAALSTRGKKLIGYLSIGEAEDHRAYFGAVKTEGILLQENKNWPGSFFVDVRDPRWTKRIIEQLIPDVLRRGFTGIFLDTADNAGYLESLDPQRYKGMAGAMASLIKDVRRHFPQMPIVMNRGFDILPQVAGDIDMVLGESILADYEFDSKQYRLTPRAEYRTALNLLKDAQKRNRRLTVLTLDYWDPADTKGIARIYREQRANGFAPYVATPLLDRIIVEPKF